jgi:hypothetical protein
VFSRFPPRVTINAITTIFCNRKRSFFNHISRHTCWRYKRPSASLTRNPTIPANKTENGRPLSGRRSFWTKLPNKELRATPRRTMPVTPSGQSGVRYKFVLGVRRAAALMTHCPDAYISRFVHSP